MKFMKRTGIYKATNVTFNPKTLDAHSYRWWRFVAVVEGKVIFNNYRYSVTTSKHQSKVRQLMLELGIKIDAFLPVPRGIGFQSLEELFTQAEEHFCDEYLREEQKKIERNEKAAERRRREKEIDRALVTHAAHESHSTQMRALYLIK
jgi:hypothetical protein